MAHVSISFEANILHRSSKARARQHREPERKRLERPDDTLRASKVFINPMPDKTDRLTVSSNDPNFYRQIWKEFVDFVDNDTPGRAGTAQRPCASRPVAGETLKAVPRHIR
jgi:hypothetical protein